MDMDGMAKKKKKSGSRAPVPAKKAQLHEGAIYQGPRA